MSVFAALLIHLGMFFGLTVQGEVGPVAQSSSRVMTVSLVSSRAIDGAGAAQAFSPHRDPAEALRDAPSSPRPVAPMLTAPSPTPAPALAGNARDGAGAPSAASVQDEALRDDYQRRLVAHIEAFKRYPAGQPSAHGAVQLVFEIDRRGGVVGVWVVKSSGNGILDVAAVDTVRRAQPVPPIPQELPGLLTMPLSVVFDEQG